MTTETAAQPDVIGAVAKVTTGTGATIAAVGGLTLTEWMGVVGVVIALAGFFANWWHNRTLRRLAEREDARQQAEHEMRAEEHRERIASLRDRRVRSEPVAVDRRGQHHVD